jgi:hypothetical protein
MQPLDYETPEPNPPSRWSRWWSSSGRAFGMVGAAMLGVLGCASVLAGLVIATTGSGSTGRIIVGATALLFGGVMLAGAAALAQKV